MNISDFDKPRRVWVNSPSTLQPYRNYHGKHGIGVRADDKGYEGKVHLYFVEGPVISVPIDPLYLSLAVGEYDTHRRGWIVPAGTLATTEGEDK